MASLYARSAVVSRVRSAAASHQAAGELLPCHFGCRLAENVYEAMARFFCERRGFSREAALSPTGPVAALLAGTRAHLQQPKQLLLGRLAGLAPSGGSGRSRSLQHPEAWHFFVHLLCCLRALQGAGWEALAKVRQTLCGLCVAVREDLRGGGTSTLFLRLTADVVQEWAESEEGVPLPLPCVMDVLANLFNTGAAGWGDDWLPGPACPSGCKRHRIVQRIAVRRQDGGSRVSVRPTSPASCHFSPPLPDAPALLDSMRRGLVPLVRQGRRGPALDLDAFLLVVLEEYSDGGQGDGRGCPVQAARAGSA